MVAEQQTPQSNIPFRLRLGVVGGRVSPDRTKLAGKLKEILETEILNLFDDDSKKRIRAARRTPLAFGVLTSLSEPAEHFAAREILRSPNSRLEVVLSGEKEARLEALGSAADRQELAELLFGQGGRRTVLNRPPHQAGSTQGGAKPGGQTVTEAGRHIVDNCDLLIALYDNNKGAADETGAGAAAAYAAGKGRPVIRISAAPPHDISVERGHGLNARSISGIERFNTFTVSKAEEERYVSNLSNHLFSEGDGLPDEAKKEAREVLMPFYVRASSLAKRSQRLYRRAGLLIYSFSAAAVAAVAAGTLMHELSPWAFSLELILLLSILALVFYANRRRAHRKWIESRFLAERLRAAIFLAVCGVEASSVPIPPYMGDPGQQDQWMTMTFDEIWGRLSGRQACAGESCAAFEKFARERWVRGQITFHEDKARKSEKINHLLESGGVAVFFLALIAAALHLFLYFSGEGAGGDLGEQRLEKILTFAAIFLPAVGAAAGGIRAHREYSRLAKRSRNMAMSLRRLEERFADARRPEALSSLLREMEGLMLVETQDWLALMSFAKLEAAA